MFVSFDRIDYLWLLLCLQEPILHGDCSGETPSDLGPVQTFQVDPSLALNSSTRDVLSAEAPAGRVRKAGSRVESLTSWRRDQVKPARRENTLKVKEVPGGTVTTGHLEPGDRHGQDLTGLVPHLREGGQASSFWAPVNTYVRGRGRRIRGGGISIHFAPDTCPGPGRFSPLSLSQ